VTQLSDESMSYEVFALSTILGGKYPELADEVIEKLGEFECHRSSHLQDFARRNVHKYEKHGNSRTYLLINSEGGGVNILGFFTVGMTAFDLTQASSNAKNKLSGEVSMDQTGAFSIAELARSDRYTSQQLPGSVILDEAKEVVRRARSYVGGRFLVVDARKEVFDALYSHAGFKEVSVAEPPIGMEDTNFVTACCVIKDWV
jgi:hypothetical protein